MGLEPALGQVLRPVTLSRAEVVGQSESWHFLSSLPFIASASTALRLRRGAFVRAGIQHHVAGLAGLLGTVHRGVGAAQYLLWGFPSGGA